MKEKIFFHSLMMAGGILNQKVIQAWNKLKSFQSVFEDFKKERVFQRIISIHPESEFQKLQNQGIDVVLCSSPEYPRRLKTIQDAPLGLYIKGKLPKENVPLLAIVGTRKASRYGKEVSFRFAKELADRGVGIVSGLAFGIDAKAHEGALEAKGITLGVLGSGIDQITPAANENLAQNILKAGGGLLSEFPPQTKALPWHFPVRNRIISGLTEGVLVIEAPASSGTLITARYAKAQEKKVFVVPGEIFSKNFEGSHQLLQGGATLVTTPGDILREFGLEGESASMPVLPLLNSLENIVYSLIKEGINSVEEIITESHLPNKDVLSIVSILESRNIIKNIGGKFIVQ